MVMSRPAKGFAVGLLLAAIPAAAQPPDPSRVPSELVVGTTESKPVTVGGSLNIKDWRIQSDFSSKGDLARPIVNGIPAWHLGMRTSRKLFHRFELGAAASATRGHDLPGVLSQELGAGRDISVATPLTGPGSYRTTWNTTLSFAVPLKTTDQLSLKAIGEVWNWNPFGSKPRSGIGDTVLGGRAMRLGIAARF
jgi:hypothetical protein